MSGGQYTPNPAAANYDHEKIIKEIDPEKHFQYSNRSTRHTKLNLNAWVDVSGVTDLYSYNCKLNRYKLKHIKFWARLHILKLKI